MNRKHFKVKSDNLIELTDNKLTSNKAEKLNQEINISSTLKRDFRSLLFLIWNLYLIYLNNFNSLAIKDNDEISRKPIKKNLVTNKINLDKELGCSSGSLTKNNQKAFQSGQFRNNNRMEFDRLESENS